MVFNQVYLPTNMIESEWQRNAEEPGHKVMDITPCLRMLEFHYWRPDNVKSAIYARVEGRWWLLRSFSDFPAEDADLAEVARGHLKTILKVYNRDVTNATRVSVDNAVAIQHLESVRDGLLADLETQSESNLVTHARTELALAGLFDKDADYDGEMKVVEAFSSYGHSGGSAMLAIELLQKLLQFKNLTSLTTDPAEWMYIADGQRPDEDKPFWQNRRDSEVFSEDAGQHAYRFVDDGRKPVALNCHVCKQPRDSEDGCQCAPGSSGEPPKEE
jgi:hypothetical protein